MIKVAYRNLIHSIERWYYQHGIYCSSNAYRIISFTCFIIVIMSIGILYSPLIHGNAVVEWRSGTPDQTLSDARTPQWLHSPPLASVQHFMLQLKHITPFEAMQTMFSIQEAIVATEIETPEGALTLSDVCLKVPQSGSVPLKGLPSNNSCLFLAPTLLWNNNVVDFLSDPDITETMLGENTDHHLRALLFGTSWTTPPHPITLTLFLTPTLPASLASKFREAVISELSNTYAVSILTEKEFKSDYILLENKDNRAIFGVEDERIHLFYSDKVNLLNLLPLAVLYVLLFVYVVFSVRKITLVKSKIGLACVAVATIVFSFVMSLGFCVFFDLLPTLTGSDIFPYIFTLVGLENVLTITRSVTITPGDQDVHIRIAQGLSTEGTRITKNVCGLAFLFIVGICSPVPAAFHEFCVVGLVCVICDFFLQLFFFVPVLSLDIRRLELADLKSGPYPASSVPVNGQLPDWTDRPRKTRIFRHRAVHKVFMLSVFLYVCFVIYDSIWARSSEKKKLSVPSMLALASTRIINWLLSADILQPRNTNKRSSYEDMFPHTIYTGDNTVDMLDQSWRRVARDNWPLLFKHYNIVVTARYFNVYKPLYIEETSGTRPNPVTFQNHVRQWLQMPVTLHLISTMVGFISFFPIALLLYLSQAGLTRLFSTRASTQCAKKKQDTPILEVPYVMSEHSEEIEHLVVKNGYVFSTSFDGLSVLWELGTGTVKLKITSEVVPWCTALSDTTILLGHGDGSVNVVTIATNHVMTLQLQTSGILFLTFVDNRTLLLCYENGNVVVVELLVGCEAAPAQTDNTVVKETADNTVVKETADNTVVKETADNTVVKISAETRIYPGSMIQYCNAASIVAVCGGSNIVKVYDARTLSVRKVLQFPQSVHQFSVRGNILVASDHLSGVYLADLSAPHVTEEFECRGGVVNKVLTTEDWIIGHCNDSSVIIWERFSSNQPNLLEVSAVDISLLYAGQYVFILQKDSAVLWSLSQRHFVDNISLDRYVSDKQSPDNKLRTGENVAFVLNGSSVVPLAVLNN